MNAAPAGLSTSDTIKGRQAGDRVGASGPPSGVQHRLVLGSQEVVVTEVGGTLRRYSVGDWDVLAGFGEDEMCPDYRGAQLAPWPNRLRDGRYHFDGDHQLPLNEAANGCAIHGLVSWEPWRVVESGASRLVLGYRLHPRSGYPFALDLRTTYALGAEGLTVTQAVTNVGRRRAPWGSGAHTYFGLGGADVDSVSLEVPAREWIASDHRHLPMGRARVEGSRYDFSRERAIGSDVLDVAFCGLTRTADGRSTVSLRGTDRSVRIWMDANHSCVMLFTSDTLSLPWRRASIAVEPMTCPPDAFRSSENLVVLDPGDHFAATWGIVPERVDQGGATETQ